MSWNNLKIKMEKLERQQYYKKLYKNSRKIKMKKTEWDLNNYVIVLGQEYTLPIIKNSIVYNYLNGWIIKSKNCVSWYPKNKFKIIVENV